MDIQFSELDGVGCRRSCRVWTFGTYGFASIDPQVCPFLLLCDSDGTEQSKLGASASD